MKYHVLFRSQNGSIMMGYYSWIYGGEYNTLEEAQKSMSFTQDNITYTNEYRVIKGEELKWVEEYEEVVSTTKVLKSKTLVPK